MQERDARSCHPCNPTEEASLGGVRIHHQENEKGVVKRLHFVDAFSLFSVRTSPAIDRRPGMQIRDKELVFGTTAIHQSINQSINHSLVLVPFAPFALSLAQAIGQRFHTSDECLLPEDTTFYSAGIVFSVPIG
jgi:hypothetical protein